MNNIPNSAKLFIQLELDKDFPNWAAISKIARIINEYNNKLTLVKEQKIQEIILKGLKDDPILTNTL